MSAHATTGSRVFVVQNSLYLANKYNLSPAERYGRLVTIMGGGRVVPERAGQAMRQIRQVLKTFNDSDFILVIGDPAAIAGAIMIATEVNNGRVKLLRWDRTSESYETIQLDTKES